MKRSFFGPGMIVFLIAMLCIGFMTGYLVSSYMTLSTPAGDIGQIAASHAGYSNGAAAVGASATSAVQTVNNNTVPDTGIGKDTLNAITGDTTGSITGSITGSTTGSNTENSTSGNISGTNVSGTIADGTPDIPGASLTGANNDGVAGDTGIPVFGEGISTEEGVLAKDAAFIYRTYYKACGDTVQERKKPASDYVGKNRAYIQRKNVQYEVVEFSPKRVVFLRTLPGKCPGYISLKLEGKMLTVYKSHGREDPVKVKSVQIHPEYLSEKEKNDLIAGIPVESEEELASLLEDYSS